MHECIYLTFSKIFTSCIKITIKLYKLDTILMIHLFNLYPYSRNSSPITIDIKQLTLNYLYIHILKNLYSTNTRLNHRRNTATPLPISSRTPPPRQDRREQSRQSRLPLLSHNPLSRRAELAHSSYLL